MKNLKTALLSAALTAMTGGIAAQQSGSIGEDIQLMTIIPTQADGLPPGAEMALRNKMNQISTAGGLGSMDEFAQFCLMVDITLDNKEVLGTAPTKIAQTTNISFYIVDQINGTLFASTSLRAKGVGDNETKAYIQSINQLNANSPILKNFITDGKKKIIDYYIRNCDRIIDKANTMASMKRYDEAIFLLMQVPDVCTECYKKTQIAARAVFQRYIDDLCVRSLAKAKSAWSSQQDYDGAQEAAQYLQYIYPEAACYKDAEKLQAEIKARVRKDLDRDWDFSMKVYRDGVDLESQRIDAIREIGVAWGKNQQPVTYVRARGWW